MFRRKSKSPKETIDISASWQAVTPPSTTSPLPPIPNNAAPFPDSHLEPQRPPTLRRSTSSNQPGKARVTTPAPTSFHKPTLAAYSFDNPSSQQQTQQPPKANVVPRSPSNPEGFGGTYDDYNPNSPSFRGGAVSNPSTNGIMSGGHRHSSTYSIASLYPSTVASPPPLPPGGIPKSASLPNVRRSHKVPPTFNIIVVGAKKTGKTALIKTILGNLKLSGTAEMKGRVERFGLVSGRGFGQEPKVARTVKAQAVSVDVVQGRQEKFTLTCIDTVGLDIPMGEGRV
ncbi:hypothetical protein P7C70_g9498, partial [Phenoliferia sp. Uapishka_3]